MARPAWGHVARHCSRCGEVGPRIRLGTELLHARCLTPEEKRKRREEAGYISDAMREELVRLGDGKPLVSLAGRSAAGGRAGTLTALARRGYITRGGPNGGYVITDAGLRKIGRRPRKEDA